jgi:hypothetical protein
MKDKATGQRIIIGRLTEDQETYLSKLRQTENTFDPHHVVGGPRKPSVDRRREKIDAITHDVRTIVPISLWSPLRDILEAHL